MFLTDDELIVLTIAAEGEYMAPIGAWKRAIERLTELGLMTKLDDVNFVITKAGRARAAEQEDADARAFIELNNLEVRRRATGHA